MIKTHHKTQINYIDTQNNNVPKFNDLATTLCLRPGDPPPPARAPLLSPRIGV